MEQVLENFENYLLSEGKAISTVKHALIYARGFIYTSNIIDLSQVRTQMILDYLVKLEDHSEARVNQAIWALRLFFKWANVPGLGFPVQKRPLKKAVCPLTEKELKAIDDWVYYNCLEPILVRVYVLLLMFYTGLRVKEIMTLSREDFLFADESGENQSTLEITKEGINRKILIPGEFSHRLQHYFRWWYEETNAFNVSIGNMRYMCAYLNQYEILGEGRKIYPELFRISFACRCLEQGMSLEELQKLLGHKSIRTTRRYLKLMVKNEAKTPDVGATG